MGLNEYSVAATNGFTKIVIVAVLGSDGIERICSNCVLQNIIANCVLQFSTF